MSENSEILSLLSEEGALQEGSGHSSPRIVVLLGGKSRFFDFPTGWYTAAMHYLCDTLGDPGGCMVLVSSLDTPVWALDTDVPGVAEAPLVTVRRDSQEQDSYQAQLAAALTWAEGIVITPDNMEMAEVACASGKPVFLTGGDLAKGRLFSFYRRLKQDGCLRPLDDLKQLVCQ